MIEALKKLVFSFNDDHGLSESVFDATISLANAILGNDSGLELAKHLTVTEDRWYFKTTLNPQDCWNRMIEKMVK